MSGKISLPIGEIQVGERRREDMGDIAALAESIQRFGLFHPIVVDGDGRLVAGGRRLAACQQLGWATIPVRDFGDLTDAERREIELEENLRRKDLTPFERSKTLAKQAEVAAEVLREESEPRGIPFKLNENPGPGRPSKVDAKVRIAERIGVAQSEVTKAEQHVETAEQFPFMQRPQWKQSHVLDARRYLNDIPDEQRPAVAALLDQPGIPPVVAIPMLQNLASVDEAERAEIIALAESPDPSERELAKAKAVNKPPMPDARVELCGQARQELKTAIAVLGRCVKLAPAESYAGQIREVIDLIRAADTEVAEITEELRRAHRARVGQQEVA